MPGQMEPQIAANKRRAHANVTRGHDDAVGGGEADGCGLLTDPTALKPGEGKTLNISSAAAKTPQAGCRGHDVDAPRPGPAHVNDKGVVGPGLGASQPRGVDRTDPSITDVSKG